MDGFNYNRNHVDNVGPSYSETDPNDAVLSPPQIPPSDPTLPPLNSPWAAQKRQKTGGREAGTPNKQSRFDLAMSARIYGLRALATMVEIMENPQAPLDLRLRASNDVLDRGFGKPVQSTQISSPTGGPVESRLIVEFVGMPNTHPSHVATNSQPAVEWHPNGPLPRPSNAATDAITDAIVNTVQALPTFKRPWEQ
jgi:hypothetical protein